MFFHLFLLAPNWQSLLHHGRMGIGGGFWQTSMRDMSYWVQRQTNWWKTIEALHHRICSQNHWHVVILSVTDSQQYIGACSSTNNTWEQVSGKSPPASYKKMISSSKQSMIGGIMVKPTFLQVQRWVLCTTEISKVACNSVLFFVYVFLFLETFLLAG